MTAENLWTTILGNTKQSSTKTIIFLGSENDGKKSLIARLKGKDYSDTIKESYGLQYHYINASDYSTSENVMNDSKKLISIWCIDDFVYSELLEIVLTRETMHHCVVVITFDLSKPWTIMSTLNKWLEYLQIHLIHITKEMDNEIYESMKNKSMIQFFSNLY